MVRDRLAPVIKPLDAEGEGPTHAAPGRCRRCAAAQHLSPSSGTILYSVMHHYM